MAEQPVETGPEHRPHLVEAGAPAMRKLLERVARGQVDAGEAQDILLDWPDRAAPLREERAQVLHALGLKADARAETVLARLAAIQEELVGARAEVDRLRALGDRRCQVCGATMQADEGGLLPDHKVGEVGRCPASRTDDHEPASISPWVSPEPTRAAVDAEVARVAREVARGWVAGRWSQPEKQVEVMRLLCAAVGIDAPGTGSVSRGQGATPARGVAAMLAEFHEAIGQPFGHGHVADSALRRKLHDDEHAELLAALDAGDLPAVAHELADVVYVAYGSAHSLGIPLDDVIAEVHRSNRTRTLRADGKMVKGPGYRPPDVAAVLAGARSVTPPPADDAPLAPQPVHRDPDRFGEGWDEDHECVTHDGAGWDLSSGCRITISHDRDEVGRPQEWTATVSTFGEDQRRGITVRTVTPQQVEAYARHLLAVVAEHGAGENPARLLAEARDLAAAWGRDRRGNLDRRGAVRAVWPEIGQRLDDLIETAETAAVPAGDPHRLTNWSRARMIRYVRAAWFEAHETEQHLAEALGYPRGDGAVLPGDEFATGDHTVVTLAMEAARRLAEQVDVV